MSTSSAPMPSSSHRLKLCWNGGTHVVDAGPDMTLKNLGDVASQKILGDNANGSAVVTLSIKGSGGGMSSQLLDWIGDKDQQLVRHVVPKTSVIQCAILGNDKIKVDEPHEKKRKTSCSLASDEALARRLQQEEDQKYRLHTASHAAAAPPPQARTAFVDPTQDQSNMWIWQHAPNNRHRQALGKWLLFYPPSTIFENWKMIADAVRNGELQQAVCAKVSTNLNRLQNPNAKGGSNVICVYTTKAQQMEVGYDLIRLVQKDIRYKLDATTALGLYAGNSGTGKVTDTTLYWNRGNPSTTRRFWTKTESEQRARKANKEAVKHAMISFDNTKVTVRGLKFGYHNHLKAKNDDEPTFPMSVKLIREPSNKHDKNAIRVDFATNKSSEKIGHVATEEAAVLAPWLDRDLVSIATATIANIPKGQIEVEVLLNGKCSTGAKDMIALFDSSKSNV